MVLHHRPADYQHMHLYREHRKRVLNATSLIDSRPPRPKIVEVEKNRERTYIELLTEINGMARESQSRRTFTKSPDSFSYGNYETNSYTSFGVFPSKHYINYSNHPNFANHSCGKCRNGVDPKLNYTHRSLGVLNTAHFKYNNNHSPNNGNNDNNRNNNNNRNTSNNKSNFNIGDNDNTQNNHRGVNNGNNGHSTNKADIPEYVIQRYTHLTDNYALLRRLLRPKIYIDVVVDNTRPLGRIVMQLYTEACPEVVLEFVRICHEDNRERLGITRLFPPMWLEGKIAFNDHSTLASCNIEHDTNVLNHGRGAGILSFPIRYVRGSKRRFLTFSISFKPLQVLNGKRVAFGIVRRGLSILNILQNYGTNNGKPRKDIRIKKCGLIK